MLHLEPFYEISTRLISGVIVDKKRALLSKLRTSGRLVGIKGARGVGKTTLLLQFAKLRLCDQKHLYISLDDIELANYTLTEITDTFVKDGGDVILVDEVHSRMDWAKELKSIYDRYPNLTILFTGSSMIQLQEGSSELSRRAVLLPLQGLSLREFIHFKTNIEFSPISLQTILQNHTDIAKEVNARLRPLEMFHEYLKIGYYPFAFEHEESYSLKLKETINRVLSTDLLLATNIDPISVIKLRQLLSIISHSAPFKPNIEKLSSRLGIAVNTLKTYLYYLDMASVTMSLYSEKKGISLLTKPDKLYLQHPNHMYSLSGKDVQIGSIRETFLLNQLRALHEVHEPKSGDFLVDRTYHIEVGGPDKSTRQLKDLRHGWLAVDGIEYGQDRRIPLWIFGFLY